MFAARQMRFCTFDSKGQLHFPVDPVSSPAPVILAAEAIVDRFEVAIQEFRSFIDSSERTDVILDRCGAWFDYGPPVADIQQS